jgi:hypothetical protein
MNNKFFFFVENDRMQVQTEDLAYGPVENFRETKYRVTSLFTTTAQAKAFAVCSGEIFIQENASNPNYVNLVLKPSSNNIENGYTTVEYFIYRGLKKSNFLTSNETILPQNDSHKTDLTETIWEIFNENNNTEPEPNVEIIGWDYNSLNEDTLLSTVFNQSRLNYKLTEVNAGDFIGYFESTINLNAGFEIVLQEHIDTITLRTVRCSENCIEINGFDSNFIKGSEPIAIMRQRDRILNYIDPAAYYMLMSIQGYDIIFFNSNNSTNTLSGFEDDVVAKFYTKDVVYVDIRNENGYSLNYYKDYEGDSAASDYGKHLFISVDDGAHFSPIEYYTDYWSILTLKAFSPTDRILISIQTLYNPEPYIYYDFAFDTNLQEKKNKVFQDLKPLANNSAWSELFGFGIPLSSTPTPTWRSWVTKIYIGKNKYDINNLLNTSLKRLHYLDYIFGPISAISPIAPAEGSQWETMYGKKLVSLQVFDCKAAVEIVLIETATTIQFVAYAVDVFTYSISNFDTKENIEDNDFYSSLGQSSVNEIDYFKENFKNLSYKELPLQDNTKIVLSVISEQHYSNNPPVFSITISRNEYENYIRNALSIVDENVHEVTLNIIGEGGLEPITLSDLDEKYDINGVPYYQGMLKIHGLDSNGNHAIDNPLENIEISTLDGCIFTSLDVSTNIDPNKIKNQATDKNAYFNVNDAIEYIKVVEKLYERLDDNLSDTCTRIRVQYYGSFLTNGVGFQALNNLIPEASSLAMIGLEAFNADTEEARQVFNHLLSHADENGFQDNPSPYLQVPVGLVQNQPNNDLLYNADFGQILYGFESLNLPRMGSGYYGFNNYALYNQEAHKESLPFPYPPPTYSEVELISYDYSGLIANIATPVAEYFYHLKKGKSPQKGIRIPKLPDLDFYYNDSAPAADLYGNADAIGIFQAYKNLEHNNDLRLSDVFTLYYKGENALQSGIYLNSVQQYQEYTADKRWTILAKYFEVLDNTTWLPDTPQWANSYIRAKLLNRMWLFAEFWYNRLVNKWYTGSMVALNNNFFRSIYRFIYVNNSFDTINEAFESQDYNANNVIIASKTEYTVLKECVEYCWETKFLTFLRAKCQEEGSI